jgi:hypothetical protein
LSSEGQSLTSPIDVYIYMNKCTSKRAILPEWFLEEKKRTL